MHIPSTTIAEAMLAEAEQMNPGAWMAHCRSTADNARRIAAACGMDTDAAYVLGLLHDIGRREGVQAIKHIFSGYAYLCAQGFPDAARICLTHSFAIADVAVYHGVIDCEVEDMDFLRRFLAEHPFDDYDRLIQLCDAISMPEGAVLMEKRLVDVAMRHGLLPDLTLHKWRAYFDLKQAFDEKGGGSIYRLLPGVEENTFRNA